MATYTNTVLPALGMVSDFLEKRAKRKVSATLATNLTKRIQDTMTPEDLNNILLQNDMEVMANEYIDPQQQQQIQQVLGRAAGIQGNQIDRRITNQRATELYDTELSAIGNQTYSIGGNQLSAKELGALIDSKITDPIMRQKMLENYTNPNNAIQNKTAFTYDSINKKYVKTEFGVDKFNNRFSPKSTDITNFGSNLFGYDVNKDKKLDAGEELDPEAQAFVTGNESAIFTKNVDRKRQLNDQWNYALKSNNLNMQKQLQIATIKEFDKARNPSLVDVTDEKGKLYKEAVRVYIGNHDDFLAGKNLYKYYDNEGKEIAGIKKVKKGYEEMQSSLLSNYTKNDGSISTSAIRGDMEVLREASDAKIRNILSEFSNNGDFDTTFENGYFNDLPANLLNRVLNNPKDKAKLDELLLENPTLRGFWDEYQTMERSYNNLKDLYLNSVNVGANKTDITNIPDSTNYVTLKGQNPLSQKDKKGVTAFMNKWYFSNSQ